MSNQTLFLHTIKTYLNTMKYLLIFLLFVSLGYSQNINLSTGSIKESDYYQEIPFEIVLGKIIIPVSINTKTYHFILDTGAPNLISNKILKEINSTSISKIAVKDGNNTQDTLEIINVDAIQLGNITFENQTALVSDIENHPFLKCYSIDGFIGSNLFKNSILKISLKNKKIIITDKIKSLNPNEKPTEMQVIGTQSKPCIWIDYQGKNHKKVREQALIDTGMDGFYDLSNRSYEVLMKEGIYEILSNSQGYGNISLFGTGIKSEQELLNISYFKINQSIFKNVTTNTHEEHTSGIGLDFFNYGDGILDFIHHKFYFENAISEQLMNAPEKYSATYINNQYVIDFVWNEELKTKIKPGNEVLRIDQFNIKEMSPCELLTVKPYLKSLKSYEMEVQLEDKSTVHLKIENR